MQGKSIKAICRELGISRKVVRKVLRSDETEFKYERTRQPRDLGYEGGYDTVRRYARTWAEERGFP